MKREAKRIQIILSEAKVLLLLKRPNDEKLIGVKRLPNDKGQDIRFTLEEPPTITPYDPEADRP